MLIPDPLHHSEIFTEKKRRRAKMMKQKGKTKAPPIETERKKKQLPRGYYAQCGTLREVWKNAFE